MKIMLTRCLSLGETRSTDAAGFITQSSSSSLTSSSASDWTDSLNSSADAQEEEEYEGGTKTLVAEIHSSSRKSPSTLILQHAQHTQKAAKIVHMHEAQAGAFHDEIATAKAGFDGDDVQCVDLKTGSV